MAMSEERTVLCGANAYDKKYYYNEITDIKEKEDADTLISTLFERYKEKTSN